MTQVELRRDVAGDYIDRDMKQGKLGLIELLTRARADGYKVLEDTRYQPRWNSVHEVRQPPDPICVNLLGAFLAKSWHLNPDIQIPAVGEWAQTWGPAHMDKYCTTLANVPDGWARVRELMGLPRRAMGDLADYMYSSPVQAPLVRYSRYRDRPEFAAYLKCLGDAIEYMGTFPAAVWGK